MKRIFLSLLVIVLVVSLNVPVFADEAAVKWKCESKTALSEGYGTWKEHVRAYTDGKCTDTFSCNKGEKRTVSSTCTGQVKVTLPKLEAYVNMKHSINKTFKVAVSYTAKLKGRSKGTYAIQSRQVYKRYKVVQRKYIKVDKQWKKTKTTKTVTTKDYKSLSYRVYKISDKDKT